jgi:outer membrane receptor protein involved in Fe transport
MLLACRRRRRYPAPMRRLPFLALVLAFPVYGFQSRLVNAEGKAVVAAQISVVDGKGTARTDAEGRFNIAPDPQLPATLIVVGSRGELYPPIHVTEFAAELRLEPAYRESVTVSSGATPNIEGTPAAAPVVIGFEEIEQRKPAHVVDAVATTPGVAIRGEGPAAVPVVRGLASGRTLILIDDARVVAERRAGPSATFVNPLSVGSIEVSRGPGSVAYGSDALGGIIHLRPRDPIPGQPHVRYDVWTSFGGQTASSAAVEVSTDLAGGAFLASVHGRVADDATDGSGETIANSQYRDRGALLRFVRDADWGRVRIGAMTSIARDVGAPTSDTVLTLYPDERATNATLGLDMQPSGSNTSISMRAAVGAYSITTNRIRTTGVESAAVKARDASYRLSAERASDRSRLVAGVDFVSRFNLRASPSVDDADRYDTGAFASWSQPFGQSLLLAAGGRVDHIATRNHGGFYGDRSTDDVAFSGFTAATVGPFRGVSGTLQVASGYREPTLSDRYFRGVSGRGFVIGNPDLEPERSLQFDGSVRWSGSRSRVALYAYDYRIHDLVERYREGADFRFRNRGEAEIRGAELEVATRPLQQFEVQVGAAIARANDLDDIAAPTLHTTLRWANARASAFVTASLFGRDDRPGPVETVRPGYTDIDLGAGWRVSSRLELRVAVRNALDRFRYGSTDALAAFAPGRSVMIGINR